MKFYIPKRREFKNFGLLWFIVQMDKNNNEIAIFESVIAAARKLGISRQGIDKVVHGTYGRITAGGYKWKFLD